MHQGIKFDVCQENNSSHCTKFGNYQAKGSLDIEGTILGSTDRLTDSYTHNNVPSFSKKEGGGIIKITLTDFSFHNFNGFSIFIHGLIILLVEAMC